MNNQTTIRTRALAAIVITVTGLWYVSYGVAIHDTKGNINLFWWAVLILFPAIALVFAAIMWWSYIRSDRTHYSWVVAATLILLLPVVLFLLIYLSQVL